jgi:hypothetical protein
MQRGYRWHKLPNEAERSGDVEASPPLVGMSDQVGEPDARRAFRDDRKRGVTIAQALDSASATKLRVAKAREAADPLAQRKLEGGNRSELISQTQLLQGFVSGEAGHVTPLAKTVPKPAGRGCGLRNRSSLHWQPL